MTSYVRVTGYISNIEPQEKITNKEDVKLKNSTNLIIKMENNWEAVLPADNPNIKIYAAILADLKKNKWPVSLEIDPRLNNILEIKVPFRGRVLVFNEAKENYTEITLNSKDAYLLNKEHPRYNSFLELITESKTNKQDLFFIHKES